MIPSTVYIFNYVKKKLNQKLKMMIEASKYVMYLNTPLHTRAIWAKSVEAAHTLLIPNSNYFILNKGLNSNYEVIRIENLQNQSTLL